MAEYTGQNRKNCGYRNLSTYYANLYGNTSLYGGTRPSFIVGSNFGGIPYVTEGYVANDKATSPVLCNTWRKGECCDGRSTSKDAYSNCASGVCASYVSLSSRS